MSCVTTKKYHLVKALKKRDPEVINAVIREAFDDFIAEEDGLDVSEKCAGFESKEEMLEAYLLVRDDRSPNEWAERFCLNVFEEYIKSDGSKTGCEDGLDCRGCCFRNCSMAVFFRWVCDTEEEFKEVIAEMDKLQRYEDQ